jgi:N-acetylmuramoyl-L-alanine amidase
VKIGRSGRRNILGRLLFRNASLILTSLLALGLSAGESNAQAASIHVIVNGQDVPLAGPAIIQDGMVMAPYQGLFEPMGIRATWDPGAQLLTLVSPAGDEMQLRPGDTSATVNGERRPIPIPLVAVLGRILIPVQWVFDTLGDVTVYDAGAQIVRINAQITDISWRGADDDGLEVTLDATAPLHASTERLHNPERLVIDVLGAVPKSPQQLIDVHEGPLATIRLSQSPEGTRIVLDLATPVQYRILTGGVARRMTIALVSKTIPQGPAPGRPPGMPPGSAQGALKITDVRYQHLDGGGRVTIVSTLPFEVTEHIFHNPDRVVFDVPDAVFIPVKKYLDVNDGLVVQVRAAQFNKDPNIVRIVVQLSRPAPYAIHVGGAPGETLVELGSAAAGAPGPLLPGAAGLHGPLVVALDAGHGGSDPGAIGTAGLQEKDVALAVAEHLRALLVRRHIDVVMVRDADVFVPLEDRAQIAARGGATLFVSIHANAAVDANANGTETFYWTPQSAPLAAAVVDEVSRAVNLVPRGASQAPFKVLLDTDRIPAILVETAFITNPREENMLRDPWMQQKFALGILQGLVRYLITPAAASR